MANKKISELTALTSLASGDLVPVVDVSDTTDSASGTTKKITADNVDEYLKSTAKTLTNKTIALGSNTVSGTIAEFNTAVTDADLATLAGTEELDNKTLDSSVGKGTWTASGTWTLPAFTAGGVITLAENSSIALDPAGSADGKYSGITITGTAGYAQTYGDLVYLASADSRWELADADAATTADRMLAMVVVAGGSDGAACTLLLMGQIRADAKFPALTIGSAVYVGETAGAIQVAIPTGADNVIRRVGYALTADEIYFNPSMDSQVSVA